MGTPGSSHLFFPLLTKEPKMVGKAGGNKSGIFRIRNVMNFSNVFVSIRAGEISVSIPTWLSLLVLLHLSPALLPKAANISHLFFPFYPPNNLARLARRDVCDRLKGTQQASMAEPGLEPGSPKS